MSEEKRHGSGKPPLPPPQPQQSPPPSSYGTFQGVANYPQPGFPQPVPPPALSQPPPPHHQYYAHGYQPVQGYAADVAEGRPVRHHRLPCCGIGIGWFLFIVGFFLAAVPWYVAAIIVLCSTSIDPREKPGYVASTIAAVLSAIAVLFGLTRID